MDQGIISSEPQQRGLVKRALGPRAIPEAGADGPDSATKGKGERIAQTAGGGTGPKGKVPTTANAEFDGKVQMPRDKVMQYSMDHKEDRDDMCLAVIKGCLNNQVCISSPTSSSSSFFFAVLPLLPLFCMHPVERGD